MKKALLSLAMCAALFALSPALFAQTTVSLSDRLYTDLHLWQGEGLIGRLPPLRPYPIQLVKKLLGEVIARGSAADRKAAEGYLSHMERPFNGSITASAEARVQAGSSSGHYEQAGLIGTIQGTLTPTLTYSAELGAYAMSNPSTNPPSEPYFPYYQRPLSDVIYDAPVSPLPLIHLTPRLSIESQTAYGSSSTYFQVGLMRASFGPFWGDSVVLSPTAPQAGSLSFTWQQGFFTYTQLLQAISATQNNGGGGPQPDKYLSLNSLEFYPTPWLSVGILESLVWGTNLNPLYLLPVPSVLFYSQGTVGFPAAAHIGLTAAVKLPESVRASFLLYQGDTSFNDLIRLDFNTMLIFAGQAGLSWTPNLPLLKRVSIGYTIVSPYSYTHQYGSNSPTNVNYENYTNDGENMATSLDPNSDRIQISALLRPLPSTDVTVFGRFIRHANASYGLPNMPADANGTIFDDGEDNSGTLTFAPGYGGSSQLFRFLTQPVIERIIQAGFNAKLYLDTPIGQVDAQVGYTFEYIMNVVDPSSGNPQSGVSATNNYFSVGAGLTF